MAVALDHARADVDHQAVDHCADEDDRQGVERAEGEEHGRCREGRPGEDGEADGLLESALPLDVVWGRGGHQLAPENWDRRETIHRANMLTRKVTKKSARPETKSVLRSTPKDSGKFSAMSPAMVPGVLEVSSSHE